MKYWLAIDGETKGPYAVEEIGEMLRRKRVNRDTPAMQEDGEEWVALSSLSEFRHSAGRPPAPPAVGVPSLERPSALGAALTGRVQPTVGPATRPVTVAPPSSAAPIIIIFAVVAVLAGGGGIYVKQGAQRMRREAAAAEAKAEEQRRAVEEAARKAAELKANPALALAGATRDEIIATLRKAEIIVAEEPLVVNMSTTPTRDADIAMVEGLKDIEVLHLGAGGITDEGLENLSGLHELRELSIGRIVKAEDESRDEAARPDPVRLDEVTDAGVEKLKNLKGLRKLHLSNCPVSDKAFETLGDMQGLYDLELINTSVTEAAARRFIQEHPRIAVTIRSPEFVIEP